MSVLTTKTKANEKRAQETYGCDGYIYYLDCGDDNTSVYICPNSPNCIHYVQFFSTNYISVKLGEKNPSTLKIIDMQLLARASTYLIRGRSRVQTLMCLSPARAFNMITLPLLHSSEDGSAPRWVKQFPGPTIYAFFFLMGMFFMFQILTQMDLGKCNSFISVDHLHSMFIFFSMFFLIIHYSRSSLSTSLPLDCFPQIISDCSVL